MSDLTSLVTEVADRVEEPAFKEITHRARTRRVRRVGATVAAVGLAAVVSVVAFAGASGRNGAVPATQQPSSVAATVRPPEQVVHGRNAIAGRTWVAAERSGELTVQAWAQCADAKRTVSQCDRAQRLGAWEVADAGGRRLLVRSPYDDDQVAYAGDGLWVLRGAPAQPSSPPPFVAASATMSAPVTLALDPNRSVGMQAARGKPHVPCPDNPWANCVVDVSAGTLAVVADLPTGGWATTNAAGWWGILHESQQGVVEQPDGSLLRPDVFEVMASPTRAFAEGALDGTIGWYLSDEEEVRPTTALRALLSTDRGHTWTLRSVPATAHAAHDWVTEPGQEPLVRRAVLPDDWRAWPVISR
jgi:hypothetical protein